MYSLDKAAVQLPLFVYGTFRHGQQNYARLRGHTIREEPAYVVGMSLYSLQAYPVAVPGERTLIGELFTLNPTVYQQLLPQLDELERSHPACLNCMFRRVVCRAQVPSRRSVAAWIYLGNPDTIDEHCLLIPHGDWVRHCGELMQQTRFGRYLPDGSDESHDLTEMTAFLTP